MKKRILSLDIIKITACLFVVIMHTFRKLDPSVSQYAWLYYFCRCAIPLFFMSSGYIQLNKENITFRYCMKKIINIVILATMWTVLYAVIWSIIDGKIHLPYDTVTCYFQIGNFSMFWFLGTMIILYLLLVPLSKLLQDKKKSLIMFIVLLTVCVSVDVYNLVNIHCFGADGFVQAKLIQTFRLWSWLLYYVAGGMIKRYRLAERINVWVTIAATVVLSGVAMSYMYYMTNVATSVVNAEYLYDSLPVILWSVSLFCLMQVFDRDCFRRLTPAVNLMKNSIITVYAIHLLIIRHIELHAEVLKGYPLATALGVFASCVVIGLILSKIPVFRRMTSL